MLSRMEGDRYQGPLHQIGLSISHSNNEKLVALERRPEFTSKKALMHSENMNHALSYRDMLGILVDGAKSAKENSPVALRPHIIDELGKIRFGDQVYRGLTRNWSFTENRAAALDGLILWQPENGDELSQFS